MTLYSIPQDTAFIEEVSLFRFEKRISFLNPNSKNNWDELSKKNIQKWQNIFITAKQRKAYTLKKGIWTFRGKTWSPKELVNYLVFRNHIATVHSSIKNDQMEILESVDTYTACKN